MNRGDEVFALGSRRNGNACVVRQTDLDSRNAGDRSQRLRNDADTVAAGHAFHFQLHFFFPANQGHASATAPVAFLFALCNCKPVLDELDTGILEALVADARRSHRDIARELGSTQPTVTARIRRMEDAGLIRGYTVRLDEEAFTGSLAEAQVVCHWCKRRSAEPIWAVVGGRQSPFCCATCRAAFLDKHQTLSKGL